MPLNTTVKYLCKDQNHTDETTTYWFSIDGVDYLTGQEFDDETFGIVESAHADVFVDSDECPLAEGDRITIAIQNQIKVTKEMRNDTNRILC